MEEFNYYISNLQCEEIVIKGKRKYFVEGFISTIDPDDYYDVVTMKAQEKLNEECMNKYITMDLEHEEFIDENGRVLPKPKNSKIPVAKIVESKLKPRGVWVKAEINSNISKFEEVWNSIKDGFLHSFSIAFVPLKAVSRQVNGKMHRFIEDLNLINVTLTGSPVNTNATFVPVMKAALKSLDNVENKMENKTPEPAQTQPAQPVEPTPAPAQPAVQPVQPTEKTITIGELIDSVKAIEKERTEFQAEKAKFLAEKAEFEKQKAATQAQATESPMSQIKSHLDEIEKLKSEIVDLKAKLAAPLLKCKIADPKEVKLPEQVVNPLDRI